MCKKEKCERHEFDYGLCLAHLKEEFAPVQPKRRTRKKKVDAVELVTTDATEIKEERTDVDE